MALSTVEFDYIRNMLREHSALSLDDGKQYLVESRLEILARQVDEVAAFREGKPLPHSKRQSRILQSEE